jgi:protein-S-isoprenylcysteine O-methyltransferase
MKHAGTNFSHYVALRRQEGHVLVKTGIYRFDFDPSPPHAFF